MAAPADGVPFVIQGLEPLCEYASPILRQRFDDVSTDALHRLHLACALAEFGQVKEECLVARIDEVAANECPNIVRALRHNRESALRSIATLTSTAEATQDWQYKARLAIVALHLGDFALAQDMRRAKGQNRSEVRRILRQLEHAIDLNHF
jgi:hypothetical protein